MSYKIYKHIFCNDTAIYHVKFDNQAQMNKTFCRFSEFNESPTLKDSLFTVEDVLQTIPDYFDLVMGHNIPGTEYVRFLEEYEWFTPEEVFLIVDLNVTEDENKFCVIATCTSETAIEHEMAHALYDLMPEYRKRIDFAINTIKKEDPNFFKSIEDILTFKKYDSDVWQDETHAVLIDLGLGYRGFFYGYNLKTFIKKLKSKTFRLHFKYNKIAKELVAVYKHYLGKQYDKKEQTTVYNVSERKNRNASNGSKGCNKGI